MLTSRERYLCHLLFTSLNRSEGIFANTISARRRIVARLGALLAAAYRDVSHPLAVAGSIYGVQAHYAAEKAALLMLIGQERIRRQMAVAA